MLQIFNTLTRKKELFKPIVPGKVRMYVCGMTVYDYCHIGHARVLVVFDVIVRTLRERGYDVTYVRNITDIDDKIIQRANENVEDFNDLTARFIEAMHEDSARLGIVPPDIEPRATESMQAIINMINTLLDKGFAYASENGDVYYDVSRFTEYGKLSGKAPADLRAGERVEVNEDKDDPLDFVLWKTAKPNEPYWDSPWGKGRPGWHIECSAMSKECLGTHFDIHGGGMDLQFPHHENEIAQSEAASSEHFVNYWMHNGFVRINEEKMSKSLGNFFTVREVFEHYQPEEVRYFILSSHYRSPLNYSDEQLANAKAAITRFYTALRGLPPAQSEDIGDFQERFDQAMDDDFNTSEALAVMFDLARDINRLRGDKDNQQAAAMAALLRHLGNTLGLLQQSPENYLQAGIGQDRLDNDEIDSLIAKRLQARANKHWAEADRIRDVLQANKIVLEDTPDGTNWRRE